VVAAAYRLGWTTATAGAISVASLPPDVLCLSDQPSSFVNIELDQTLASHFQQQGLAHFLIRDIGAFHDLMDFERLLAQRTQDILSVVQHDQLQPSPTTHDGAGRPSGLDGLRDVKMKPNKLFMSV
jgi:hypothetical protein